MEVRKGNVGWDGVSEIDKKKFNLTENIRNAERKALEI